MAVCIKGRICHDYKFNEREFHEGIFIIAKILLVRVVPAWCPVYNGFLTRCALLAQNPAPG
jgi:hypothetical protein